MLRPDRLPLPLALRVRVGEPVTLKVGETDVLRVVEVLGVMVDEGTREGVACGVTEAGWLAPALALMLPL